MPVNKNYHRKSAILKDFDMKLSSKNSEIYNKALYMKKLNDD